MNLKEMDQFITDPEPSASLSEMLVDPVWLHQVLRKLNEQGNVLKGLNNTVKKLQEENSTLRHSLLVAKSNHPYTQLINCKV